MKPDFKNLLEKQITHAKGAAALAEKPAATSKQEASAPKSEPAKAAVAETAGGEAERPASTPAKAAKRAGKGSANRNLNRTTVNLFESDRRALAVIQERLSTAGHDFTNRSDSMKIGLRLAANAKPEELAKIFEQVKSEDRRFRSETE